MDVPTHDTIGLNIYRELIGRANRSVGTWEKRYGKEVAVLPLPPQSPTCGFLILWSATWQALTRKIDPAELVNLSTFDSTMGMPMPLDVQVCTGGGHPAHTHLSWPARRG